MPHLFHAVRPIRAFSDMLKRDRTSEEKRFDGMVKSGLMRLGEHPSNCPSAGQSSEVTESLRPSNPFPHVLVWDRWGRKGQRVRVINPTIKAAKVQVQFEDGFVAAINRQALRRSD